MRGPFRVWRIVKKRRAVLAFDGEGAKREGGRWNSIGVLMVYASATISLALLETLVHADQEDLPTERYVAIPIDIPPFVRVKHIAVDVLPKGWQKWDPSPPELKRIGDEWVGDCRQVVLSVPSAVVPQERNFLINPAHSDMNRLIIGTSQPIPLDGRLLKKQEPPARS